MRVAVLDDYLDVARNLTDWSPLRGKAELTVFTEPFVDEDAAAEALADFEIIVAMRERTAFPASLLARLGKLKLLVTTGMRNASIDMAAAKTQGAVVSGTGGGKAPTSEQTWALILGLARNIPHDHGVMREGGWQTRIGMQLQGRTLGLLGLGSIGEMVAKVALAFGMDVIAWSQNLTEDRAREVGVTRVEKEALFEKADFLSIHLVLSDRSRGLVGAGELALMKPTAYLVNTSRAPIVDAAALLEALRSKRIAGAGLDVYETEPLPADDPLRQQENVLLAPHMGYVSDTNITKMYTDALEDITAWLDGAPIRVLNG